MMDSIFELIPVKLLSLGLLAFYWHRLIRAFKQSQQTVIAIALLTAGVMSIGLSVLSVGKLYPYGAMLDLLIFALAANVYIWLGHQSALVRFLSVMALILPFLVPLFYLLHILIVGGPLNKDSFIAIFQTNTAESIEYIMSFTSLMSLLPFVALSAFTFWLFKYSGKRKPTTSQPYVRYFVFALIGMTLMPAEKGLFSLPFVTYQAFSEELAITKNRLSEFKQRNLISDYQVTKDETGETYVVIVGESLNKHHMGIYGYELDTTPLLQSLKDNNELMVLSKSYSNYPGTIPALSHALTQANQKNNYNFNESLGVIEVLNQAGFKTQWIGNQPLSNSYDMILGLIAKEAHEVQLTFDIEFHSMSHKDHKPDGVLLPYIDDALAKLDPQQNNVIFVHLMGSHTDYCERYPEEYEKFTLSAWQKAWTLLFKGGLGHTKECYDNSILYNDFFVHSVIQKLESHLGNSGIGGLFYFADHSEDITRGVGHSSANFSYEMVESPAMIWLSQSYKQAKSDNVTHLKANENKLFSNDFMFDSILGMLDVSASEDIYCSSCDIFKQEYELEPDQARTMHRQKPYKPFEKS